MARSQSPSHKGSGEFLSSVVVDSGALKGLELKL